MRALAWHAAGIVNSVGIGGPCRTWNEPQWNETNLWRRRRNDIGDQKTKAKEKMKKEMDDKEEEEEAGQDRVRPAALGCACIRPRNLDCRHTSTSTTFYHEMHPHTCTHSLRVWYPLFTQTNEPVFTYALSGCNLCAIVHTRGGSTLDARVLPRLLAVKYPL